MNTQITRNTHATSAQQHENMQTRSITSATPAATAREDMSNVEKLSSYFELHDRIEQLNAELNVLRKRRTELRDDITEEIQNKGPVFGKSIKLQSKREYNSLTFQYVKDVLSKVISSPEDLDKVMELLKTNRTTSVVTTIVRTA